MTLLPNTGHHHTHPFPPFTWVLGIELMSFFLNSKHLVVLTISPAFCLVFLAGFVTRTAFPLLISGYSSIACEVRDSIQPTLGGSSYYKHNFNFSLIIKSLQQLGEGRVLFSRFIHLFINISTDYLLHSNLEQGHRDMAINQTTYKFLAYILVGRDIKSTNT